MNFDNFANEWIDGLPVGNGRIAAMLWGDNKSDVLSLNHEWLWTGRYKDRECDDTAHFLPFVRDYLEKGENFKATALAAVAFGGNGGISPLARRMDSYQPAGELVLRFNEAALSVNRSLEMQNGVAKSEKIFADNAIKVCAFCHVEEDIFAVQWTSEHGFCATLSFEREETEGALSQLQIQSDELRFTCDNCGGVGYTALARYKTDGVVQIVNDSVIIENATFITILANIGTQHKGIDHELAKHSLTADFTKLLETQCEEFAKHMEPYCIELEDENTQSLAALPINKRKQRVIDGKSDASLLATLAYFGIYLMVAGSIKAELPLNLQGKWNRSACPKWNSDYHFNINLQMNYWFTDALGMNAYSKQMTDYVLSVMPSAQKAAKKLYGCRGALFLLNSDCWGKITPEAYNYAVWVAGAGWLASHFWRSYLYTGNKKYLQEYAYPFIKQAALFYEDYLVIDKDGTAQIMPSQSPENKYAQCGYFPVSMCISSAMDVQIAYETLGTAVQAATLLQIDESERAVWQALQQKLPPFRIGKDGRLLEWDSDDKQELEKGHRHVSHLYGVYPASLFTPEKRVEQYEAAKRSLAYRIAHSGGYTGWSSAWSACLGARFLNPNEVHTNLERIVGKQSSSSLLDLHPDFYPIKKAKSEHTDEPALFTPADENPPMIFQIDGNLGATAALLEALVQTRDGRVYLLPSASALWRKGKVNGMYVPGGHKISFTFENGEITSLCVTIGFEKQLLLAPFNNRLNTTISGYEGEEIKVL